MERMISNFDKYSTKRNLGIFFLASMLIVIVMGYLTQILVYDIYGDFTMPDTRLGYTFAEIQAAFASIGSEGLLLWAQVHLLDYIFPLTYSFAMVFGIMLELRSTYPSKSWMRYFILLPLLGGIADYVENLLILSQVLSFPNLSELIITIASAVTILKWVFLAAGFIVIICLIVVVVFKRVSSR